MSLTEDDFISSQIKSFNSIRVNSEGSFIVFVSILYTFKLATMVVTSGVDGSKLSSLSSSSLIAKYLAVSTPSVLTKFIFIISCDRD